MAGLVYNALGGTVERPCPTRSSQWFEYGHCSRDDVQMWRAAAANLYHLGIIPMLKQLEDVDPFSAAERRGDVEAYRESFGRLSESGSRFSTAQNLDAVTDLVGLMARGELLITKLREGIILTGATPEPIGLPPQPQTVREKSPWSRFIGPAVAVGGLAAVVGLVAIAARSSESESEGEREA